ncbi:MAG: DUF342 domain-containing protein [Campylobacterales bacterium]|nr:DUF342 domain-containing protein [Campylobacterales bacterium]
MSRFTPVHKRATQINKTIAEFAAHHQIKPELIDFDLLSYQTFYQTPKQSEWTLLNEPLESLFEEKMIRSELLRLHQEYEIRLRPLHESPAPISLSANKTKSKIMALIKAGSTLVCEGDSERWLKEQIYKRKLRAGLMIGLFEPNLDAQLTVLGAKLPCNAPLESDVRLIVGESPGAVEPIHEAVLLHYDKKAKSDNQLLQGVDEGELVAEYIKPKRGRNGRGCDGVFVEVAEPKSKYASYLQCDSTLLRRESDDNIAFFAKISGYVKNERGLLSISKELSIKAASFRKTGSIDPGLEREIVVNIAHKESSEDAIGSGVSINVKELNVKGTVGASASVRAEAINVGEQTHKKAQLEALEHANIKLHRGRLKAKTAKIEILETGSVVADEVHVRKMLGGEIIAERVIIDELISNATVTALESIEIGAIFGGNNQLIIDARAIESYAAQLDALQGEIKGLGSELDARKMAYTNRHSAHIALAPRIKTFQKKLLAAQQSGQAPLKADIIRIKQYKQAQEELGAEAEALTQMQCRLDETIMRLRRLEEADLHARIRHKNSYDGQSKVIFIETRNGRRHSFVPEGRMGTIFLRKEGDETKIAWEN